MHSPEIMASILSAPASSAAEPEEVVAEYVELPLNHFGKKGSDGTYQNRFWVSTDAYKPGAPVFLYDVGEADGEAYVDSRLRRNVTTTNMFRGMVDKYQGIGIVWEHRYCEFTSSSILLCFCGSWMFWIHCVLLRVYLPKFHAKLCYPESQSHWDCHIIAMLRGVHFILLHTHLVAVKDSERMLTADRRRKLHARQRPDDRGHQA